MQVKKFEAPTLQEALDTIKRELGPEAIILQTKQNRKGFGLMSKGSVEVTAAVSERSIGKKKVIETRLPEAYSQKINALPAKKQADVYDSYLEKKFERDQVQLSQPKRITAVRYADIEDDADTIQARLTENLQKAQLAKATATSQQYDLPQVAVSRRFEGPINEFQLAQNSKNESVEEEIQNLKRLVEELRRERKKPEYLDSDSPFEATDALQESYELLLQTGVEKRFSVQIMREVARNLDMEARADRDKVLDAIASQILGHADIRPFFRQSSQQGANSTTSAGSTGAAIIALVGASGVGKTAMIAKLATHAARARSEKVGLIRIQLSKDETSDPLQVFSRAIHVPYRLVKNADEFAMALQDFGQSQWIFIDTPGVSPRDVAIIEMLKSYLLQDQRIRTQVVLAGTTRELEMNEQGKAFLSLRPESLMFSKLDETYSYGSIYSMSKKMKLPVSVFSTGRKVTEDWENATAERLTASILNIL